MDWDEYQERNDISPLDDDYYAEKMSWESENNPLSDDYVKEDYRDRYDE